MVRQGMDNPQVKNRNEQRKDECLRLLGGKKCKRCGVNHLHPAAYDFHHTKGDKGDNISRMIANGTDMETIKEELKKCVILCKNCHAETHALKQVV
jgi:hypothetical protein